MNYWISLGLTFVISFLISAGGAYLSAASGGAVTMTVVIGSIVTGIVAAAQAVQKKLEVPPSP